jgi:hypothetical protein
VAELELPSRGGPQGCRRRLCFSGYFQSQKAQFGCTSCDILGDFYQDSAGQTSCKACPPNARRFSGVLSAAQRSSCRCTEDYYPEYSDGDHDDNLTLGDLRSCKRCPNGAVCCACDMRNMSRAELMQNLMPNTLGGKGKPCEVCQGGGPPMAIYGFFMSSTNCNSTYLKRRNKTTCAEPVGVPCPLEHGKSCLGGPDSNCSEGYVDVRCGRCDEHHYLLMHKCRECGEPWAIWLCGVVLPILVLAGCVWFLWFESGHRTR